jgi:EmrB/QacA subfamily drug resistance transporter
MDLPCANSAIATVPVAPQCVSRKVWVLSAAILASTMAFVDQSIVNVALPSIESDLHATLASMQWVVNAYTLCMSALLLNGGSAADQYGRRLIFIIGLCVFAAASVVCGLAGNIQTLLLARAVQGTGAALLVPCSLALIGAAYEPHERGAAIGIWSGASAIAAGAAPLLGGWIVDHLTWRVIFLINPLLALPTLWIAIARVPESRNAAAAESLDWRGTLLCFAGLGALVYGLTASSKGGWLHLPVVLTLIGAVILLGLFARVERTLATPMLPFELFRSRTFLGVNLLTLLLYGALGAAFFFLPFLLIEARDYSTTATGLIYLPFTLVLGVLSRWSGRLSDRFGARNPLIIGPLMTAAAFVMLSLSTTYGTTLLSMTFLGLAMAVTVAPLTTTVLNSVPASRTGVASGINNAVASSGGLLLIALLGSICLSLFDHSLSQSLVSRHASASVLSAVQAARNGFIVPTLPAGLPVSEQRLARQIIAVSLASTVRVALWIAALLAVAAAACAAITIPRQTAPEPPGDAGQPDTVNSQAKTARMGGAR